MQWESMTGVGLGGNFDSGGGWISLAQGGYARQSLAIASANVKVVFRQEVLHRHFWETVEVVTSSIVQMQLGFYSCDNASDPSGFTDAFLAYGECLKQPLTVSEWVSICGLLTSGPAPAFDGPLHLFEGERDWLLCCADCKDDWDPNILRGIYPDDTTIDVYLQRGAGHGLLVHENAAAGFAAMLNILDSQSW